MTDTPAVTVADLIAKARPRETTVRLCLAGDLVAEHEHLDAELEALSRGKFVPTSLVDADPAKAVAERIVEVEKAMLDATVEIRLRALTGGAWQRLVDAHPGKSDDERFDVESLAPALLAATAVAPTMTVDEARTLLDALSPAQQADLFNAAWRVCQESTSVPFSQRASVVTGMRERS